MSINLLINVSKFYKKEYVVARGGIEPPTHGFSVRFKLFSLTTTGLYQLLLTVE